MDIARSVLEQLYKRASAGEPIGPGDFDGLIRHAREESVPGDGQAQIATRRRVVKARTPMQSGYMRALEKSDLVFGVGPAGTGKTYLAVAYAAHCLSAAWSSASSCRVPPSRPASGSASCRATCARRSIPICARSTTRSTTCCRRRRSSATSRPA